MKKDDIFHFADGCLYEKQLWCCCCPSCCVTVFFLLHLLDTTRGRSQVSSSNTSLIFVTLGRSLNRHHNLPSTCSLYI